MSKYECHPLDTVKQYTLTKAEYLRKLYTDIVEKYRHTKVSFKFGSVKLFVIDSRNGLVLESHSIPFKTDFLEHCRERGLKI